MTVNDAILFASKRSEITAFKWESDVKKKFLNGEEFMNCRF